MPKRSHRAPFVAILTLGRRLVCRRCLCRTGSCSILGRSCYGLSPHPSFGNFFPFHRPRMRPRVRRFSPSYGRPSYARRPLPRRLHPQNACRYANRTDLADRGQGSSGGRAYSVFHARLSHRLYASRHSSDRAKGRVAARGGYEIRRRQDRSRTHLLGSGMPACSDRATRHPQRGLKRGSVTSVVTSSKTTSTGRPTRRASLLAPTRLPVRRTPSSSSTCTAL